MTSNLNLIEKSCQNSHCQKTWRQLESDKNNFCSKGCREWWENHWQSGGTKKARSVSIIAEHGEQLTGIKKSGEEKRNTKNGATKEIKRKYVQRRDKLTKSCDKIKNGLKNIENKNESTIKKTESGYLSQKEKAIGDDMNTFEVTTENTTKKIEKESSKNQEQTELSVTQQLCYQKLLNNLNTERLNSIESLDHVGTSLLTLAQKNPIDALRALTEFRNVMKTKLEYMKYGNELIRTAKNVDDE